MQCQVANCPSQDLAFTNAVFMHPRDYTMLGGEASTALYVEVSGFVYTARANDKVESGGIGMNSIQRRNVGA